MMYGERICLIILPSSRFLCFDRIITVVYLHDIRGVTCAKIICGCACGTSKIWLSLHQYFAKLPTHQYTFFDRKAPNFSQIGRFLTFLNFAQNTPNFEFGLLRLWWKPTDRYPNFVKKHSKRQAHIHIPSQYENPPRHDIFCNCAYICAMWAWQQ